MNKKFQKYLRYATIINLCCFAAVYFSSTILLDSAAIYAKKKKKKKRRRKKRNPPQARGSSSRQVTTTTKKTGKFIKRRVLILDFVNQKSVDDFNYLIGSIPEAMIDPLQGSDQFTLLSRDRGKKVAARIKVGSTELYQEDKAITIAKEMNADVVVIGNFIVIGSDIQMQSKALDVHSGRVKVAKTERGKTSSSIFGSIGRLAKKMSDAMAKKLPRLEQSVIHERETIRESKSRKLLLSVHANYAMPSSNVSDAISPLFNVGLFGNYRLWSNKRFSAGGEASLSYLMQKQNSSFPSTLKLNVIGMWGGGDFAWLFHWHKPVSLHIHALGGYAISLLNRGLDNKIYTSGDPAVKGLFEIRYTFKFHMTASLTAAYERILYQNSNISEILAGVAIGYLL